MISINEITIKNFQSFGSVPQTIKFNDNNLTLIIGENLDLGGGDNRNGVGKTTILQVISYALYGKPITQVKKDNLINKINSKGMMVSIDFSDGTNSYRIERGRKPNYFKWLINDKEKSSQIDETQGEGDKTQREIDACIGMSHNLFKHLVVLSAKTIPFLSLSNQEQGKIIEELLGIKKLREKSEVLKDLIKETKDSIKMEDVRIKTIIGSNEKINRTINDISTRMTQWDADRDKKINIIHSDIESLSQVDIDQEIDSHTLLDEWVKNESNIFVTQKEIDRLTKQRDQIKQKFNKIAEQLEEISQNLCPTCKQEVHDEKYESICVEFSEQVDSLNQQQDTIGDEINILNENLLTYQSNLNMIGSKPTTHYHSLNQAYNHKNTLQQFEQKLNDLVNSTNPYADQIQTLKEQGIQEVSYQTMEDLNNLLSHQEFLNKLLTNNESFIRKKIIDQNISLLNNRLNHYLENLKLSHEVVFQNDLSVQITLLGKEYDFEQLSRGEENRLILSLCWAFRDVWEMLNTPINVMFIDEMVDTGMDTNGMESALEILRNHVLNRKKSIYLISHKDDLFTKVDRVMLVQKEGGFSAIIEDMGV